MRIKMSYVMKDKLTRRPKLQKAQPGEERPEKVRVSHSKWAAVDVSVGSVVVDLSDGPVAGVGWLWLAFRDLIFSDCVGCCYLDL
ncbi:hypothetical protein L484_012167 [Morus notabilis]|uniref:Uncharacterized protein n=1 Tax=Morus notabilis TaxID=981085 RepID=W9R7I7_9ROSA|nr:hypothetical protein L484_012167 [Morus notabilis]